MNEILTIIRVIIIIMTTMICECAMINRGLRTMTITTDNIKIEDVNETYCNKVTLIEILEKTTNSNILVAKQAAENKEPNKPKP